MTVDVKKPMIDSFIHSSTSGKYIYIYTKNPLFYDNKLESRSRCIIVGKSLFCVSPPSLDKYRKPSTVTFLK